MKISRLKKIYPYIKPCQKNINWRPLRLDEFQAGVDELQKTCNCFSNATRIALFNSDYGRKILEKRIQIQKEEMDDPAYKIVLTPNGKKEIYRITKKDYFGKFFDVYKHYTEEFYCPYNFNDSESKNLNIAFDIAVSKMIHKHPEQKPWYMRIYDWPNNKRYEYNKPSRAFEWLTGIKPIQIGENGYRTELIKYKDKVLSLLEKLGNMSPKDYSFILMSGSKETPNSETWHCLPITKVDNIEKRVYFTDKRKNKNFSVSFNTIVNNFKAIVGINWKDLENSKKNI